MQAATAAPPKKTQSETIKVCVRCRPLSSEEVAKGHAVVVDLNKKTGEIFVRRPFVEEAPKQFTFDSVFDLTSHQSEIYTETSAPIIANVLEGYNGTIFAYG